MTVVKGKRRRSAEDGTGEKVTRLNLFVGHEAYQRLMVNSVMEGLSPGLFLDRLITDHCKAWQMPARGSSNPEKPARTARRADPVALNDRLAELSQASESETAA